MSGCRRTPLTPRRKAGLIAALAALIAASAPVLLQHAGRTDWTDAALGGVIGLALALALVMLVGALRSTPGAS